MDEEQEDDLPVLKKTNSGTYEKIYSAGNDLPILKKKEQNLSQPKVPTGLLKSGDQTSVSPYAPRSTENNQLTVPDSYFKTALSGLPEYSRTNVLKQKYSAPQIPIDDNLSKNKKQILENNNILQTINSGVAKQNDELKFIEQQFNSEQDINKKEQHRIQYNDIIEQQKNLAKDYTELEQQNRSIQNTDARTQQALNKAVFDQLSNQELFSHNKKNVDIFFDTLKKRGYTDEQIEQTKVANKDLNRIGIPVKTKEEYQKEDIDKKAKETSYLGGALKSFNESFDSFITSPIDAAAKLINDITFGSLETLEDRIKPKKQGERFTEIGKWGARMVESTTTENVFGSSNMPEGLGGEVLTGLAALPPMLITIPLFKGVPLGAASSDMLGAAQKVAPAFASQMGTTNFLNKYGETGSPLESAKALVEGAAMGTAMHAIGTDIGAGKVIAKPIGSALEFLNKGLGINSVSVSKLADDIYKGGQLTKVSAALANGGIFGSYITAEELAHGAEDGDAFLPNAIIGTVLASLGIFNSNGKPRPKSEIEDIIADNVKNNAVVNYFSTPIEQINDVKASGKTPEEIRIQAEILGEKAIEEKDKKKREALAFAQIKMNILADAASMDGYFATNSKAAINVISNSKMLTNEQKTQFIDKIQESADAYDLAREQAIADAEDAQADIAKSEQKQKEYDESIKISELIDKDITYNGQLATLSLDGQTVVVKIKDSNKEYELGNVEEISSRSIKDYGLEQLNTVVNTNEAGNVVVRGSEYINNYSDPKSAINYDKEGNILSVNLETTDGKKRTFRGNIAEDIAYQIHLKEITENNGTKQKFEEFINTDEPTRKEVINEGLSETIEVTTTKDNEKVQREKIVAKPAIPEAEVKIEGEQLKPITDAKEAKEAEILKPALEVGNVISVDEFNANGYELPAMIRKMGVKGVIHLGENRFDILLGDAKILKDVLIHKSEKGETVDNKAVLTPSAKMQISYNGKMQEVDMDFKVAAQKVNGNLKTGEVGYVKMPNGDVYEISLSSKTAKLLPEKIQAKGEVTPVAVTPIEKAPSKDFTAEDAEILQALQDTERTPKEEIEYQGLKEKQKAQVEIKKEIKAEPIKPSTGIAGFVKTKIKNIVKNLGEFQGRSEAFSPLTYESIISEAADGTLNISSIPAILVWGKTGELLAGHSRVKAFEDLASGKLPLHEKFKPSDFDEISTQIVEVETLAEAKDIALKSNRGAQQTAFDNSRILAKMRSEGKNKTAIDKMAGGLSQHGDKKLTIRLSYLSKEGLAARTLEGLAKNPEQIKEKSDRDTIHSAAEKAGEMREKHEELTTLHEDEIYQAITKGKIKASEVADRVNRAVNGLVEVFDPNKKLNIEHIKDVTPDELIFQQRTADLRGELNKHKRSIKKDPDTNLTPIEQTVLEGLTKLHTRGDKPEQVEAGAKAARKEFETPEIKKIIATKTEDAKLQIKRLATELQDHIVSGKFLKGNVGLFDEINENEITNENANRIIDQTPADAEKHAAINADLKVKADNAKRISDAELNEAIRKADELLKGRAEEPVSKYGVESTSKALGEVNEKNPENTAKTLGLEYGKSPNGTYAINGELKGITLSPKDFKRTEFEGQDKSVEGIGAEKIDLSEPIQATMFSDGTIKVIDGHHRLIAANKLGKDLKVDLTFRNAKPHLINKTIAEAYHKAKENGTNPELVKAVESLLGKPLTETKYDKARQAVEELRKATQAALRAGKQNLEGLDPNKPSQSGAGWTALVADLVDAVALATKKLIDAGETIENATKKAIDTIVDEFRKSKFYTDLTTQRAKDRYTQDLREKINKRVVADAKKAAESKEKIGITHAKIKEFRLSRGEEDLMKQINEGQEERFNRIHDGIEKGKIVPAAVIDEVLSTKRASPDQIVTMQIDRIKLQNEYEDLEFKISDLLKNKEFDAAAKLMGEKDAVTQLIRLNDEAAHISGSTWGLEGKLRQQLFKRDYSLASIERRIKNEQYGKELSKEQEELAERLSKEIPELKAKLQRELDNRAKWEEETRATLEKEVLEKFQKGGIKEPRETSETQQRIKKIREKRENLWEEFKALKDDGPVQRGFSLNSKQMAVLAKIAVTYIEGGLLTVKQVSIELKKDIQKQLGIKISDAEINKILDIDVDGKKVSDRLSEVDTKEDYDALADKIGEWYEEGKLFEELKPILNKMFKLKVEEGVSKYMDAIEPIYEAIKDHIPDKSIEQVRDLISGYGEFKEKSKDPLLAEIAELKLQARLDAKIEATERGEMYLRNGIERAEKSDTTRAKERKLAKNVKEKNLISPLTPAEIAKRGKTDLESHHRRLGNAIADVRTELAENKRREKSQGKEYTDQKSIDLQANLDRLNKIKEEKLPKEPRTEAQKIKSAISSLETAIKGIEADINKIKAGETVDKPTRVKTKDGKQIFSFGKEKAEKLKTDRIDELRNAKAALQSELSDLMPDAIKDRAILDKNIAQRKRRLDFLTKKLDTKSFAPKPKKPAFETSDKEFNDLNDQIRAKENELDFELQLIQEKNMTNSQRVARAAGKTLRFGIFLGAKSMGKLTLAGFFRPVIYPLENLGMGVLSNFNIFKIFGIDNKAIMAKNPARFQRDIIDWGAMKAYYGSYFNPETHREALRAFTDKGSKFDLRFKKKHYESSGLFGVSAESPRLRKLDLLVGRILAKPQQAHGWIKSYPKHAKFAEAFYKSLKNITEADPRMDPKDPRVQDIAAQLAATEGYTDIFMNSSESASAVSTLTNSFTKSENHINNATGLLIQQNMPVLKIPINFYYETIQKLPMGGTIIALGIVRRAGKKGEFKPHKFPGGVENLTPEQARRASTALTNQLVGYAGLGIGIALYHKYDEEVAEWLEEKEYWLHNTLTRIVIGGINVARMMDVYNRSFLPAVTEEAKHILWEEFKGLPPVRVTKGMTDILSGKVSIIDQMKKSSPTLLREIFGTETPKEKDFRLAAEELAKDPDIKFQERMEKLRHKNFKEKLERQKELDN